MSYYYFNRDKKLEYQKEYNKLNKELINLYHRQYYNENKEKYRKNYYYKNLEKRQTKLKIRLLKELLLRVPQFNITTSLIEMKGSKTFYNPKIFVIEF